MKLSGKKETTFPVISEAQWKERDNILKTKCFTNHVNHHIKRGRDFSPNPSILSSFSCSDIFSLHFFPLFSFLFFPLFSFIGLPFLFLPSFHTFFFWGLMGHTQVGSSTYTSTKNEQNIFFLLFSEHIRMQQGSNNSEHV